MIVRIRHSEVGKGSLLIHSNPDDEIPVVDVIEPDDELLVMLGGDSNGYFEAEPLGWSGWDIKARLPDQGW